MSAEIDSKLNELIRNPGFEHIPILVFQLIDTDTLEVCRKVSKEWKQFIDNSTPIWKGHLAKARESMKKKQDKFIDTNVNESHEADLGDAFVPDHYLPEFYRHPGYKKWKNKFWKFWTQVFDHYEFEVSDLESDAEFDEQSDAESDEDSDAESNEESDME